MNDGPLKRLFDLLAVLRGENGCPWDREQRPGDILSDLIEEAYELQCAWTDGNPDEVLDETGDVLFVLVFAVALLAEHDPRITIENLVSHACEKITRRHPHVFAGESARSKEEGLAHWERIKSEERSGKKQAAAFDGISRGLPPIRRAEKIQKRAAASGFDWRAPMDVVGKIREELREVEGALGKDSREGIEEEIGDLLFSVLNLSRFLNLDGEKILAEANAKFVRRYEMMERLASSDGKTLTGMPIDEMERYWRRTKHEI